MFEHCNISCASDCFRIMDPDLVKTSGDRLSVYAPTLGSSDDIKDKFYEELTQCLHKIPNREKILLLGDFNARVGRDYEAWPKVLGRHGVGNINSNGQLLLSLCAQFQLAITNTMFRLAAKHKTTWMHPRSKHWHLIDYAITRQRDISQVLVTRACAVLIAGRTID
ncbi:hypothetical protein B5X24_HaOG205905 [Helicoverpa armigera]|uniref:Endonuclease/exonuclease/phosphatase domain-containing protein n=1 Tax=Helicoverpa armigera TaxID=29058 RepID=A0A2W1BKR4_HELAM|nr:hypothetical protein B5X24_HaOG205905 [Helicoverpa armigera]